MIRPKQNSFKAVQLTLPFDMAQALVSVIGKLILSFVQHQCIFCKPIKKTQTDHFPHEPLYAFYLYYHI